MEGCSDKIKEEIPERKFQQRTLFDIQIDPGLRDDFGLELPRPFTKNQMRKWLKKVRWENNKAEKRRKEKIRAKERRQEARAANIDLGPSRKSLKKWNLEKSKSNIGIIIDLSFDNLMIEKDRYKMIKQILRCYSINRRSRTPLQFYVTSFGDKTKLDISRHNGYENWDINFKECGYTDIFPKEKLFYLTSESDNVIESFAEDTFYIIGGLVDHNQHKGLCHKIAIEQGIRHGKLPLNKYVNMKTRKVLTIDHVFEIVLRVSEGVSWQHTLLQVLPMRKGAHVFDTASSSSVELSYEKCGYTDIFPKEKLFYLTSESDNVIESFAEDTFYIIGGLVDHNQHKGLCHKIAIEQGIRHGKLPLNKYVNMKTRKVLTIDHVFEIVLRVSEGVSWQHTLLQVLPMRKGAHVFDTASSSSVELSYESD